MLRKSFRPLLALLAMAATFAFTVVESDARVRGGFGSRGSKTYAAPPPTATAPKAGTINRSMTQPGQPGAATAARPAAPAGGGFFNRPGLLGGLAAGFLGAGLIGLLMGNGFLGGLAGLASLIGLILQVGLIALVAMLAWRWWQRRSQPALAAGPDLREAASEQRKSFALGGALGGGHGSASVAPPSFAAAPLELGAEDFDTFERLLGEVQTAYGREDMAALRPRLTPEMLSYFAEELAENASRGVVNEITDVKLLQGDLSEAWREDATDYATVAMRYSLVDRYLDRASGRAAEGNEAPQEATELWTFRRDRGGSWVLSAIQQG
ncbi:MAG: hypothetical protein C3F17_04360 [Bradyrhizobiaceae bacterium]|nr:MAG: hypothetical protein C3F17_04360 [Bradyrhizobiaceae bacterium]